MPAISALAKTFTKVVTDNSPKILTAMAVTGVVSTTVLAVQATPQALVLIEDARDEKGEVLTPMEKVKVAWLGYVPAAVVGSTTIACIIGGHAISTKRNAALMSLWSLAETGFREYQDKVTETIGQVKEQKIRDDIAQDKVNADPPVAREVIIIGTGDVLCYDSLTARYFQSDMESLRRAENDLNSKIINDGSASLNDFYRLIGLDRVADGDEKGWSTDNMFNIEFSATLSTDARPCMVVSYRTYPTRGSYVSFL